jgi:hypothetical protein
MKRVGELLFRSALASLVAKPKSFQLLEMDFLLDKHLRMHYVASNAHPAFSRKVDVTKQRKGDFRSLALGRL